MSKESKSSGTAVISLDFSSVTISLSTSWFSAANALTTWFALWLSPLLPQMVFPSTAITEPSLRWYPNQSYRHSDSASGLILSNTLRNVSLSGIPWGSSRNFPSQSSLSLPNSSISGKYSPPHTTVHSPMIMMYSSLCRIWPPFVRRGSSTCSRLAFKFSSSIFLLNQSITAVRYIWPRCILM